MNVVEISRGWKPRLFYRFLIVVTCLLLTFNYGWAGFIVFVAHHHLRQWCTGLPPNKQSRPCGNFVNFIAGFRNNFRLLSFVWILSFSASFMIWRSSLRVISFPEARRSCRFWSLFLFFFSIFFLASFFRSSHRFYFHFPDSRCRIDVILYLLEVARCHEIKPIILPWTLNWFQAGQPDFVLLIDYYTCFNGRHHANLVVSTSGYGLHQSSTIKKSRPNTTLSPRRQA